MSPASNSNAAPPGYDVVIDRVNGMHWLHGELDPETGAALFTALQRQLDTWFHRPELLAASGAVAELVDDHEHLAAHALTHLCTAGGSNAASTGPDDSGGGNGPSWDRRRSPLVVTEVSVLVDLQTMRSGLHPASICETSSGAPLPPATIRRLACDAKILPIVMNGPSLPVDLGRSQRVANRTQRRALRAAHRTCVVPGCTVAFDWCQVHHLLDWLQFGPTDLANLAPLCHRHHHLVHEGGWTLTLDEQRQATLWPPHARANPPPTVRAG